MDEIETEDIFTRSKSRKTGFKWKENCFFCYEICSEKHKHEPRYTWSKVESLQNSTYGGKQDIYKAVH